MRQFSKRFINADAARSLDKNSQRSLELVGGQLPAIMRPFGRRFAGVPGTGICRGFHSGKAEYRMYCFTKD